MAARAASTDKNVEIASLSIYLYNCVICASHFALFIH